MCVYRAGGLKRGKRAGWSDRNENKEVGTMKVNKKGDHMLMAAVATIDLKRKWSNTEQRVPIRVTTCYISAGEIQLIIGLSIFHCYTHILHLSPLLFLHFHSYSHHIALQSNNTAAVVKAGQWCVFKMSSMGASGKTSGCSYISLTTPAKLVTAKNLEMFWLIRGVKNLRIPFQLVLRWREREKVGKDLQLWASGLAFNDARVEDLWVAISTVASWQDASHSRCPSDLSSCLLPKDSWKRPHPTPTHPRLGISGK